MAVVRITETLRNDCNRQARSGFETRRLPLKTKLSAALAGSDEFRNAIFETVCDLYGTTPVRVQAVEAWTNKVDQVRIDSINGVTLPYGYKHIRLNRAIPWPTDGKHDLADLKSPRLGKWAVEAKDILEQMDALDNEERTFLHQLDHLLTSCSTYRQAVEIWPQLKAVTPTHVWNRHEEKVERVKAAVPKPTLNIDELNRTAVLNTIANSQK